MAPRVFQYSFAGEHLKFRKELKENGGDSEKRKENSRAAGKTPPELDATVEPGRAQGYISGEDRIMDTETYAPRLRRLI